MPEGQAEDRPGIREPWLGVELRHLAALSAVARTGTFREAAEELGYVQSAISAQISFLEQLVGLQILERTRGVKGVSLTDAGQVLLVHAEEILARFHAARADLETLARQGATGLRVGVPHSVAAGLLPLVLRRLESDGRGLRIEPTEALTEAHLLALVERGELDATFAELPVGSATLETHELLVDAYVLLVNSSSHLARINRRATAAHLWKLPLVAHDAFPVVEEQLRAHGIKPVIAYRSDATATVEAMVAAGVGAAVLPRLALGRPRDAVAQVELGNLMPARKVGLCWARHRHEAATIEAFRDAAAAVAASLHTI